MASRLSRIPFPPFKLHTNSRCARQKVKVDEEKRKRKIDKETSLSLVLFLNRYLLSLLNAHLHPPTLLPPLLSTLRKNLFPNSALPLPPSPATTPPSPAEQLAIKRSCARSLISLFPLGLLLRFFSARTEEEVLREVESELLDVWSDGYLNRHVAYQVLELVVVRILPEMAEKGVSELMERRLGEGT